MKKFTHNNKKGVIRYVYTGVLKLLHHALEINFLGAHRPVGVCNIRTVTIRSEVWSVADSVSSTSKDVRQGDEECECG